MDAQEAKATKHMEEPPALTPLNIDEAVNRFLGWKLPENFAPDAGISFKKMFNEHTAHPMRHEPTGTNLLDAVQAKAMLEYVLQGFSHPAASAITKEERDVIKAAQDWRRQHNDFPEQYADGKEMICWPSDEALCRAIDALRAKEPT